MRLQTDRWMARYHSEAAQEQVRDMLKTDVLRRNRMIEHNRTKTRRDRSASVIVTGMEILKCRSWEP